MNTSHLPVFNGDKQSDMPNAGKANSLDRAAETLIDVMLGWGVSASTAYWIVLLLRLPAWIWYPIFMANAGTLIYFFWSRIKFSTFITPKRWAAFLLFACLLSASINVFTNHPDDDDFSFSHRALVAVSNLSSPIAMTDTAQDVAGLPAISPLHVFTSIEVTTALVALALGIPQVLAIHMGLGTLVNFMLPVVYFLLLRFFRVRLLHAAFGIICVLIFLSMSGNVHRDWGYFTILRSWQGKCILMELIVPLSLLYSLRFHLYGRRPDVIRLHAVTCCGIGLSGTGLFLLPFVIGISGVAAWGATGFLRSYVYRVRLSSTILFQPILVSILPWLGLLPKIGNISAWTSGWPLNYYNNLELVFHAHSIPLYLSYICAAFLIKRRVEFFALLIYFFVALIVIIGPGVRYLLMYIVTPGAYWRFAYALLIPLWVGLAAAGVARFLDHPGIKRISGVVLAAMLIIFTWVVKIPAVNSETISKPGLKFKRDDLDEAYLVSNITKRGGVVLAPSNIVVPLALIRPDTRFIVTRPIQTLYAFADIGRKNEGSLRSTLGSALADCNFSGISAVRVEKLWPDVNVVVYPSQCETVRMRKLLGLNSDWKDVPLGQYQVLEHQ